MKTKTKPSRVRFLENPKDLEVLVLARLGQHTRSIARQTGYTPAQAQYRIMVGGGKGIRWDYREGATIEFRWAVDAVGKRIGQMEKSRIAKNIAEAQAKLDKYNVRP